MGGPRSRPWSLSRRLAAWHAASAFGLIAIVTSFLYRGLLGGLDHEDDRLLGDKVQELRMVLAARSAVETNLDEEVARESDSNRQPAVYIRILGAPGRPVVETAGMSGEIPPAAFPPRTRSRPSRGREQTSAPDPARATGSSPPRPLSVRRGTGRASSRWRCRGSTTMSC